MINGKHYVAGQWVAGAETFRSSPFRGTGYEFARGNAEAVDDAVTQGVNAFNLFPHYYCRACEAIKRHRV